MNQAEKVEFTCPRCGVQWIEWQDPNDEWFKLATNQILCVNCGQVTMEHIIAKWNDDNFQEAE